jgi:hypothetical protein
MNRYDQLLVAPGRDDLDDALGAAVALANRPGASRDLGWLAGEYEATWQRITRQAEGSVLWGVPPEQGLPDSGNLRVMWWSDCLGRRHVRVVAVYREGQDGPPWPEITGEGPPLFQVYPAAGFAVRREVTPAGLLVVCPCGATGTPAEIAWMGMECGPCHDRRAAGVLPYRPWEVRLDVGRSWHTAQMPPPIFVSDGSLLLFDHGSTEYAWDLATGQRVPFEHPAGQILAWSADGEFLAAGRDDGIHIVRADTLQLERTLKGPWGDVRHTGFSPSGRYFLVADTPQYTENTLQVWDLHAAQTEPVLSVSGLTAWTLSPDERTLYTAEYTDSVRVYPLESTEEPRRLVVPGSDTEDAARVFLVNGLHLTPDGQSLILNGDGLFRVLDLETGTIVRRRHLPAFGCPGFPSPLLAGGRILLMTDHQERTLNLVTLPDLANPVTLTAIDGPGGSYCAWNNHWLAVADYHRVRLIPLPPLLEWYLREARR